jgi:hypothetical protein
MGGSPLTRHWAGCRVSKLVLTKEIIVAYFKILSHHLSERTRENREDP